MYENLGESLGSAITSGHQARGKGYERNAMQGLYKYKEQKRQSLFDALYQSLSLGSNLYDVYSQNKSMLDYGEKEGYQVTSNWLTNLFGTPEFMKSGTAFTSAELSLKSYWENKMPGWFLPAALGLSVVEGISGASTERNVGEANVESIDEQIALLNKQREELAKAFTEKKSIVTDKFGNKINFLQESTAFKSGNIRDRYDTAAGQTDLAFSGTVEYGREKAEEGLRSEYGYQREGLQDMLGESLFNIDMERTEKFGQIDSQILGLKAQRKVEEERSNASFLGLGLGF